MHQLQYKYDNEARASVTYSRVAVMIIQNNHNFEKFSQFSSD